MRLVQNFKGTRRLFLIRRRRYEKEEEEEEEEDGWDEWGGGGGGGGGFDYEEEDEEDELEEDEYESLGIKRGSEDAEDFTKSRRFWPAEVPEEVARDTK